MAPQLIIDWIGNLMLGKLLLILLQVGEALKAGNSIVFLKRPAQTTKLCLFFFIKVPFDTNIWQLSITLI